MSHDKELIERMVLEKNDKKLIDLLADEAIDDWKSQDGWRYADFDAALRWMFKRGIARYLAERGGEAVAKVLGALMTSGRSDKYAMESYTPLEVGALLYANAAPCARCAELDSTFGQVIADAAKELGCDPDNEAILESIFALSTKLKQQTERADFAWKNTQTIDKARAEEMLKRDELQAKITEQAALISELEARETILVRSNSSLNIQRAENDSLKEVISLSEDSRLMDEYLKLERANARQAERIKEQADHIQALEAEAADRESFLKTLADTCTEAERIAIERAGRIDVLESECRKLRDALSELEKGVG